MALLHQGSMSLIELIKKSINSAHYHFRKFMNILKAINSMQTIVPQITKGLTYRCVKVSIFVKEVCQI